MKHAVILAHPKPDSFCAAIARACVDALTGLGHTAVSRDLYALDFDPRLKAEELPTATGARPAADVVAERAVLADADSLIFVYPFWFNAPPAMLKGYVDRVFGMGFGYMPGPAGLEPLLGGKSLISLSTSGAPDQWVKDTGALKALMTVFDLHLAGVCGLSVRDHRHFGGVVPQMTAEAGEDLLRAARDLLTEAFDPKA
jgi:NAD(P)H dehydrogenase (quinone)